jgi:hypothetical protein
MQSTICVKLAGSQYLVQFALQTKKTVAWLVTQVQKRFQSEHGFAVPVDHVVFGSSRVELPRDTTLDAVCGHLNPNDKNAFLEMTFEREIEATLHYAAPKQAAQTRSETLLIRDLAKWKRGFKLINKDWDCAEFRCVGVRGVDLKTPIIAGPAKVDVDCAWIPPAERAARLPPQFGASGGVLRITDEAALKLLRKICPFHSLYEQKPSVLLSLLLPYIDQIDNQHAHGLDALAAWLRQRFDAVVQPIIAALADRKIMYDGLWKLFAPGVEVVTSVEHGASVPVAFVIRKSGYEKGAFGTTCFVAKGYVIKSNSTQLFNCGFAVKIASFDKVVALDALPLRLLDKRTKARLAKRGRKLVEHAQGAQFRQYSGLFRTVQYGEVVLFGATGRCMIDGATYAALQPSAAYERPEREQVLDTVPAQELFRAWPFLESFSFSQKRWGEALIDGFAPIQWRDDAFEHLVLDADVKRVLRIVVPSKRESCDLIEGKSGGTIVLLRGGPGTGKTLTAESLAELLHQPLYYVRFSDLGATAQSLQKGLDTVFRLALAWRAVLLLDEADVLLRRRGENLERNAMVGVALSALEYYQGVLFLTSNLAESFDPAVMSRIDLVIHYPDADAAVRAEIWRNMLQHRGLALGAAEIAALAQHELNGREIRRLLGLALTMSAAERKPCTAQAIEAMIQVSERFAQKRLHSEMSMQ